jgi:hypothetical protein
MGVARLQTDLVRSFQLGFRESTIATNLQVHYMYFQVGCDCRQTKTSRKTTPGHRVVGVGVGTFCNLSIL